MRRARFKGDYRFGSYGVWSARGRHPFEQNLCEVLLPVLRERYRFSSTREVYRGLKRAFAEARGLRAEGEEADAGFSTRLDRRVRYWVDGLVIGSEFFVREAIQSSGGLLRHKAKALVQADSDDSHSALCAYKEPRAGG